MITLKRILLIISAVIVLALPIAVTSSYHVSAQTPEESICIGSGGTWNKEKGSCSNGSARTVGSTFQQVADVLIFIVGAISVIMIIIGGLRYTISAGDQSKVTSAKNTVLYALVGLVIAFLSYAIVNFILVRFKIL